MKLLFLDVDGVLNSEEQNLITFYGQPTNNCSNPSKMLDSSKLDPVRVGLINHLCKVTGCEVVITSTWRLLQDGQYLDYWNNLFDACVKNFEREQECHIKVTGLTLMCSFSNRRSEEIATYLETLQDEGKDVHSYCIMDDNYVKELNSHPKTQFHFIKVDPTHGVSFNDTRKAINMLRLRPSIS